MRTGLMTRNASPFGACLRVMLAALLIVGFMGGGLVTPDEAEAYQGGDVVTPANQAQPRLGPVTMSRDGVDLYTATSTSGTQVAAPDGGTRNTLNASPYSAGTYTPDPGGGSYTMRLFPNPVGCRVGQQCDRGQLRVTFPHPVTNPRVNIGDLGGGNGSYSFAAHFSLATDGVTLSRVSGTNTLVVEDTVIRSTSPAAARSGSCNQGGGCGTIQIEGTVTELVFNMSIDTAGPTNGTVPNPSFEGVLFQFLFDEDFGDAPASYDGNDAARHLVGPLQLGAQQNIIDNPMSDSGSPYNSRTSPKAGAGADQDNDNAFPNTQLPNARTGTTYAQTVPISGAEQDGTVCGWIDFNRNGAFDNNATERSCANFSAGATSVQLSWNVPAGASLGDSYARYRIGFDQGQTSRPTGNSNSGEVEDYRIRIEQPQPDMTLTKTADPTEVTGPGQQVTYTFVARNTGNVDLNNVEISDPLEGLSALSCDPAQPATLAPNAELRCTATRSTTAGDVNNGRVDNTASAKANPATGGELNRSASASVRVNGSPAISLEKSAGALQDANNNNRQDAGDTIEYSFRVTNTGDQRLTDIAINDPKVGTVTCPQTQLNAGEAMTCTITYTVTQADVDNGAANNTATVAGTPPNGGDPVRSNESSTNTTIQASPAIALDKQAGALTDANNNNRQDAGDTIRYTFRVTNTGNVTLNPVTVDDPKVGSVTCPEGALAPGASVDCDPVTYTVTQNDVDDGRVDNTATASGTPPSGDPVEAESSTNTPIDATAEITLTKTADPTQVTGAGQQITYTFVARNTGDVELRDVEISDPLEGLSALSCDPDQPATLVKDAELRCTATYTTTAADVENGKVDNTATVRATPVKGGPDLTANGSATVTVNATPSIGLEKSAGDVQDANNNNRQDAGDTIEYSFRVTNTGDVSLSGVSVNDPKVGTVDCPQTTLAVGEEITCTATYTVTQADVDAGEVVNRATSRGTPPNGGSPVESPESSTRTPIQAAPSVGLEKQAGAVTDANGNNRQDAGDTIRYTFRVTNTGNVTLNPVTVDDPKVGPVTCPEGALAPGASRDCEAVTYTITQADVDNGRVDNTATVSGTPPSGDPVTSTSSTTTPIDAVPAISLTKTADPTEVTGAGQEVTYTFVARNTGDIQLQNVEITDPIDGLSALSCDPAQPATLAKDAEMRCTATRSTTAQDVENGQVNNTATVKGNPANRSGEVNANASANVKVNATPSIALEKSAGAIQDANNNNREDAGDTIEFTFLVTNTGDVSLSDIAVDDPKVGAVTCLQTRLEAGAQTTCRATYTLTQADVDAGEVRNTATVAGTPPNGGDRVRSPESSTQTPINAPAAIALDKVAGPVTDANENNRQDAGDTITYTFRVTNTGALTLNPVTIDDPKVGPVTCPEGALAPGDSRDCSAVTYTLTQEDVDAGVVRNTATTTGTPPRDLPPVTAEDSTETPVSPAPALSLVKSAGERTAAGPEGPLGDTINYTFQVTNTGNVTMSNIAVDDPKVGAVDCPEGSLAPGASKTCSATYTVTQEDVDADAVVNTATATGTPPGSDTPVRSNESSTTTPLESVDAISLTKSANPTTSRTAGEIITYTFVGTNTGEHTLSNVAISDPLEGMSALTCDPAAPATLAPGATITCTATRAITEQDIDRGQVQNTATITGTPPGGRDPISATAEAIVTTEAAPAIALKKGASPITDANNNGRQDAGDTITYTFTVTNTGNLTLDPVTVDDPKVGPVVCPGGALAPGESRDCLPVTYTLTVDDVKAGKVDNTATATGTPPGGRTPVTAEDSTTTPITPSPAIGLDKRGELQDENGNQVADIGEKIQYSFVVSNTGNTPLSEVSVNDPMLANANVAVECPTTNLGVGESTTCTALYTVRGEEIVDGKIHNEATATGRGVDGTEITTVTSPKSEVDIPTGTPTSDVPPPPPPPSEAPPGDTPPPPGELPPPPPGQVPPGQIPPPGSELPPTGIAGAGVMLWIAAVLVTAGGILLLIRRRGQLTGE